MFTFDITPESHIFLEHLLLILFGVIALVVANWETSQRVENLHRHQFKPHSRLKFGH